MAAIHSRTSRAVSWAPGSPSMLASSASIRSRYTARSSTPGCWSISGGSGGGGASLDRSSLIAALCEAEAALLDATSKRMPLSSAITASHSARSSGVSSPGVPAGRGRTSNHYGAGVGWQVGWTRVAPGTGRTGGLVTIGGTALEASQLVAELALPLFVHRCTISFDTFRGLTAAWAQA